MKAIVYSLVFDVSFTFDGRTVAAVSSASAAEEAQKAYDQKWVAGNHLPP